QRAGEADGRLGMRAVALLFRRRVRVRRLHRLQLHDSSSDCSALLIATAAFTPSAAATTTNWASREASPTTNSRGTLVSHWVPVFTVPREVSVHPSLIARSDCGCCPVVKNTASRGSVLPPANAMPLSAPL